MKLHLLHTLIFATLFYACKTKTQETTAEVSSSDSIKVERSRSFEDYPEEKHRVADFIEAYFNIMYDSSSEVRNNYWDSKILASHQDHFLHGGFEKAFLNYYPPKILGIRALNNDQFMAKVSFEENHFTFKIMNLKVAFDGLNRPYFIDLLGENLKRFEKTSNGSCTFYYSPNIKRNEKLEKQTVEFNKKLGELFEVPPFSVQIIALKNIRDYCDVLGYDYSTVLTFDSQTGGIALPKENIIFSANGSAYYPHELVHLYTALYSPHDWFDEGLSTYLGGSVEFPLEYHLAKIAGQMDELDFTQLPENKKLDDDTNFKYAIGGLFCKLAFENYGKESLMTLMNSGKSDEEFFAALRTVFNVERDDLDAFVRKELQAFRSKE